MIEIRRIAPEEYSLLEKLSEGYVPPPEVSIAVVGFDGEKPVARVFLMAPVHLEGTYIAPEYRKGTVAVRLIRKAEEEGHNVGLRKIYAFAPTEEIADYMRRLGYADSGMTVLEKEI